MTPPPYTALPLDKSYVCGEIFADTKWNDKVKSLGLIPVFIGSDLEKMCGDAHRGVPVYLALCFVIKDEEVTLSVYPDGFPERDLFFHSLKKWEWSNEGQFDIRIKNTSIELNISEYYATATSNWRTYPASTHRLATKRPGATAVTPIAEAHMTHMMTCSDENPSEIILFYHDEDSLLIMGKWWGKHRLWQFIPRE